jgi:hypothetical protein
VSGKLDAPAALPPGEGASGTHWVGGWVGPIAGLDDVEKRTFFTLPGFQLQPLGCLAHSQSLYQLRYPGSPITPCSPLKVSRLFGGICRIHLQDRRMSRTRNQPEARSNQSNRLAEISDCIGNGREMRDSTFDFQRTTLRYIPEDRTLH